jgi:hypothetical protein
MTGQSVMNGTWLRCDPTAAAPSNWSGDRNSPRWRLFAGRANRLPGKRRRPQCPRPSPRPPPARPRRRWW